MHPHHAAIELSEIRRAEGAEVPRDVGARGVLVSRPLIWGLAAYGADGVQTVIDVSYSETARRFTE